MIIDLNSFLNNVMKYMKNEILFLHVGMTKSLLNMGFTLILIPKLNVDYSMISSTKGIFTGRKIEAGLGNLFAYI
jgi:hypothetical protein